MSSAPRHLRRALSLSLASTALLMGISTKPADAALALDNIGGVALGPTGFLTGHACQEYFEAYGGVYNVKFLAVRHSTAFRDVQLSANRRGAIVATRYANTWWDGKVAGLEINLSRYYGDTFTATTGVGLDVYFITINQDPSKLPRC